MKSSVLVLSSLFGVFAVAQTWQIENPHSAAGFKIRHLMVTNVNGNFSEINGTVNLEDDFTKTTAQASIPVKSINTSNKKRDEHLLSPDFFDVKRFPTIEFKSKSAIVDNGTKKVVGDLKMHGVTKEVTLEVKDLTESFKDMNGALRRGITLAGKINRRDFGLSWGPVLESGTVVVGDEVKIEIDIQLVPKKDAPSKKT